MRPAHTLPPPISHRNAKNAFARVARPGLRLTTILSRKSPRCTPLCSYRRNPYLARFAAQSFHSRETLSIQIYTSFSKSARISNRAQVTAVPFRESIVMADSQHDRAFTLRVNSYTSDAVLIRFRGRRVEQRTESTSQRYKGDARRLSAGSCSSYFGFCSLRCGDGDTYVAEIILLHAIGIFGFRRRIVVRRNFGKGAIRRWN